MKIIGTHDSATGERGWGIISILVTPFARTQAKTIIEQYQAGARYFDFRVRLCKDGLWHCAHGLWRSKRTFLEMVADLAQEATEDVWFGITLESKGGGEEEQDFIAFADELHEIIKPSNLHITTSSIKLPNWKDVKSYCKPPVTGIHHCFVTLDYSTWHTYLPIPWLWNEIYEIGEKDNCINTYDFF